MPLWAPVGRGHVAFWCFCFSLDIYPGVDLLDHSSRFGSLRNLRIVFHSSCAHLPSHQQAVTGLLSARAHTPHSRGTGAAPASTSPGGWLCLTRAGLPSMPGELLPPREDAPPVWSPFLRVPRGSRLLLLRPPCWFCVAPSYSLGWTSLCSLPVTSQWDCSACRCVCVCGARGVLAWGFLLCHSSRNSSYKIFFLNLWRKTSVFLGSWVFFINLGRPKLKLFCRYSWLLPENRSCTYQITLGTLHELGHWIHLNNKELLYRYRLRIFVKLVH